MEPALSAFFFPEKNHLEAVRQINYSNETLNQFKLFHINIQCLSNKIDMLSIVLENLGSDIVCLSEHWYDDQSLERVNLNGYTLNASYCRGAGLHGGVAIYCKSDPVYKDLKLERFSIPFHAEFAGIEVTELNCVVVVVYWSPLHGKFSIFLEQIDKMLSVMYTQYKKLIIAGDFNCDPGKHPADAHALKCVMSSYNLRPTVDGYTRITQHSRSCLDNVYINFNFNNYEASIYDPAISDHAGQVLALISDKAPEAKNECETRRVVSDQGLVRLKAMLTDFDWQGLGLEGLDGDQSMSVFIEFLRRCMSECMVVKSISVRKDARLQIRWFTEELKAMRNTVEALKTVCSVTQKASDWSAYRAYKNTYRKCIVREKRAAYGHFIESSENRQKSCWALIKGEEVSSKSRKQKTHLSPDDFNSYFVEVAQNIVGNLPDAPSTDDVMKNVPVRSSTIFLHPITPSELMSAIHSLKNKKSLDCYGMSAVLLKFICEEITIPLTAIFNVCIAEGVFPGSLKINKVVPVFKKGSVNDANNYRPIAITSVLAKIFEIIIKDRLLSFFNRGDVFASQQFGFRKHVSTTHAVLKLLEDAVDAFDDRCRTEVTLCDLTKAFDCISPSILLEKLDSYGVRGVCLGLLRSYLTDRRQYVALDKGESRVMPQTIGVPQGSVLGPVLFLIYINDLPSCVSSAKMLLFADDTTLYCSHSDLGVARAKMQEAIEQASSWFVLNKLALNSSKTQGLTLATDKNVPNQSPVSLLGIVLDQRLTWASHVDQVCARVSSGIYALRNLTSLVTIDVMKIAYFALVQSHLAYGVLLWGGSAEARRAFIEQKKAIRVMVRAGPRAHCRDLFRSLGILTLPSLYIYVTCLHVRKISPSLRTRADVHSYGTRGRDLYLVPASRTRTSEKNKINISLYNSLPTELKSLTTSAFKSALKQFLLENAYYSVDEHLSR